MVALIVVLCCLLLMSWGLIGLLIALVWSLA